MTIDLAVPNTANIQYCSILGYYFWYYESGDQKVSMIVIQVVVELEFEDLEPRN